MEDGLTQFIRQRIDQANTTLIDPQAVILVFDGLHLVYEGYRLNVLKFEGLLPLGNLLSTISTKLGWRAYSEYYHRAGCDRWAFFFGANTELRLEGISENCSPAAALFVPSNENPPSIYDWILNCLSGKKTSFPIFPPSPATHQSPTDFIRKICLCYQLLCFGSAEECFSKKSKTTTIAETKKVAARYASKFLLSLDLSDFLPQLLHHVTNKDTGL